MTEYQTELTPPVGRVIRPGRDLLIDLVIMLLALVLVLAFIPALFLIIRAKQQGMSLTALSTGGEAKIIKLLGVDGILAILIAQNAIFAGIPIARVLWRRESLASIGLSFQQPLRQIATGVGLGILVLLCNGVIGAAFLAFGIRQNQSAQYPLFAGDYIGQAFFFFGAAVLAPLGEEILFRGYLFHMFQRIWGHQRWGVAAAIGVSGLCFALAHSLAATQGLIGLLVPAFLMGVLLAFGAYMSKSIVPTIIAHMMNNGLALLGLIACVNGVVPCPKL